MGALKSLMEANKEAFKSERANGSNQAENIPVIVDSFDDHFVYGKRLDNQEDVKITLGRFNKKEGAEFDRPDFDRIFNNGKKSVQVGGVLQFESAQKKPEGHFESRWANVVAKDTSGQTKAVVAKAQVFFGSSGDNKFISIKTAFPNKVQMFDSEEQVRSVLTRILTYSSDGVVPFYAFKISDGEDTALFEARAKLVDVEDNGKTRRQVAKDPSVSVEEFLSSKLGQFVMNCIQTDGVTVSGCNGVTMYVGKDTKDNYLKKKSGSIPFVKKEFMLNEDGDYFYSNLGYKDVVVGVRVDGSQKYVTHFMSVAPYNAASKLEDLIQ